MSDQQYPMAELTTRKRATTQRTITACVAALLLSTAASAQIKPTVTIGGENDAGAELGKVAGTALPPGLIVVLEADAPFIRVFGLNGKQRQVVGRKGRGPGEFVAPNAITFDSASGRLYVTDQMQARVAEYVVGDTLRLVNTLTSDVINLHDVCKIGGTMFGLTSSGGAMIVEFDVRESQLFVRRRFVVPNSKHALVSHPVLREQVGQGRMRCDGASQTIYTTSYQLGEVHIVTTKNGTDSIVPVRDVVPIQLTAVDDGGLQFTRPKVGYYDQVVDIIRTANGVDAVSKRFTYAAPRVVTNTFSVVSIARDGTQSVAGRSKWQYAGKSGTMVVCVAENPYPTVALFSAQACP